MRAGPTSQKHSVSVSILRLLGETLVWSIRSPSKHVSHLGIPQNDASTITTWEQKES